MTDRWAEINTRRKHRYQVLTISSSFGVGSPHTVEALSTDQVAALADIDWLTAKLRETTRQLEVEHKLKNEAVQEVLDLADELQTLCQDIADHDLAQPNAHESAQVAQLRSENRQLVIELLRHYVKAERLELVLDRPSPAFGGQTARQLIDADRGLEVLNSFRATLSYQVPV